MTSACLNYDVRMKKELEGRTGQASFATENIAANTAYPTAQAFERTLCRCAPTGARGAAALNRAMNTTTLLSAAPVRYDPAVETFHDDEAQTHADLVATLVDMEKTMADHTGHAMRAVHAKSHGLLRGELRVLDGLPEPLAQGLFAAARRYRWSCACRRRRPKRSTTASRCRAAWP
jgi:hypothetical protein